MRAPRFISSLHISGKGLIGGTLPFHILRVVYVKQYLRVVVTSNLFWCTDEHLEYLKVFEGECLFCLWEMVYSFLPHVIFTPVFQESHQAEEKSRWRSQRGELRLSERIPTLGRRLLRSFVPSLSLTSWPAPCWSEARSRGCGVSNCVGDISIVPIAPIIPC